MFLVIYIIYLLKIKINILGPLKNENFDFYCVVFYRHICYIILKYSLIDNTNRRCDIKLKCLIKFVTRVCCIWGIGHHLLQLFYLLLDSLNIPFCFFIKFVTKITHIWETEFGKRLSISLKSRFFSFLFFSFHNSYKSQILIYCYSCLVLIGFFFPTYAANNQYAKIIDRTRPYK